MNATPRWIIRTAPPDPRKQEEPNQPDPPKPEPSFGERVGNFFTKTIPGWVRSAADWLKHKFDDFVKNLTVKPNTTINGVDKRLVHIAAAIGVGCQVNCVCSEGMRDRGKPYGARDSEHIYGKAMDLRLTTVPGATERKKEQFVADVATVLGYGGQNEKDRVYVSVHDGTARHLHFQLGSRNIGGLNPIPSSKGGQADFIAAQERIANAVGPDGKKVGREGLERIMQTRMPDELAGDSRINSYTRYNAQETSPTAPRLVYAQPRPDHAAPKPAARTSTEEPIRRWYITTPAN